MFIKENSKNSADTALISSAERAAEWLNGADAVVIGAGAGLSAAAGFTYSGGRFRRYFSDFENEYGFHDMYSGGFYPFPEPEIFWAYWSRYIAVNRYDCPAGKPYEELAALMRGRDFFVLTTNVDHRFRAAGFPKERLFYTQGDYGLFQCSLPCHKKTYDNESAVREMVAKQRNMRIPSELIPRCPVCGRPMSVNLRSDSTFVEDEGWHAACARYEKFLEEHAGKKVLFLEIGVGMNTPGIIKIPFLRMTLNSPDARYAAVNPDGAYIPGEIADRAICLEADAGRAVALIRDMSER